MIFPEMNIDIVVHKAPFREFIDVALVQTDQRGDVVAHATGIQFEEVKPGSYIESNFSMRNEFAQRLMDGLWRCGLRPTEGIGSVGALSATERHLSDMQKIAFSLLDIGANKSGKAESA